MYGPDFPKLQLRRHRTRTSRDVSGWGREFLEQKQQLLGFPWNRQEENIKNHRETHHPGSGLQEVTKMQWHAVIGQIASPISTCVFPLALEYVRGIQECQSAPE